ncbi:MAG: hypothetical protein AB7O96_05375 [Pseudobdellovibrionaceae bacterium]
MMILVRSVFLVILFVSSVGHAFSKQAFGTGLGFYSQNFLNETAAKNSGETGFMGTTNFLFNVKYDIEITSDWFFSPELGHTLLPRDTSDKMAKVTITHLVFPFGQNISNSGSGTWDWYAGPGLIRYSIKGEGGTVRLNNGTSTSIFAKPGRNVTIQKVTTNIGSSYTYESSRFGLDLIIENLMSTAKRSQSFMLSYAYQFGGSR